jgi:hypothetical protein
VRSYIELRECSFAIISIYLTIYTTIDAIDISNSLLPIDVNNTIHTIHTTDVNTTIVDTIVVIV